MEASHDAPKPMRGAFDATCKKCGRSYGWLGTLASRPPCPKCGHQVTLTKDELDAFEAMLNEDFGKEDKAP